MYWCNMVIIPLEYNAFPIKLELPVATTVVSAGIGGFPSPANDYEEETIDLNSLMVKRPAATFFAWASGDSMLEVGISDGDLLIVDRSVEPQNGAIVVATLEGEYVCKLLDIPNRQLLSANGKYPPYKLGEDISCIVSGVVTGIVKRTLMQQA